MGKEVSERLKILDRKPRLKALFILLFRSEDFVTSTYIAEKLNVTSRTIKSDINELKSYIQDLGSIESKRSFGYKLHISNPSYIEQIKELFQIFPSVKLEKEKDTVVLYILRRLVSSSLPLKIEDFQSELLTTSPLTKELQEVKNLVSKYGLTLQMRPKYGIEIVGPQFKKVMLSISIYRYFDRYTTYKSGVPEYESLFACSDFDEELIRKTILSSITKSRIVFSDLNIERFIIYLIYFRNNYYLKNQNLELQPINFCYESTDEHKLVVEIIEKLNSRLSGFDFEKEIIQFLTYIAVISTDLYRFSDCSSENYNQLLLLAQETRNFILRELSDYFRVDFFEDYTCFKDTLKIMLPISLKILLRVSDSIDIRYKDFSRNDEHPILRYFVEKLSSNFYKKYAYEFSKRELDILYLTFLGVLNRIILDRKKLRLAIIAIDGRLSTQQLKFNLQHYFSNYIERIETKTLYELNYSDDKNYDYYLCSNFGKNLNISQSPIYFIKDGLSEFDYDDSFSRIFFDSYSYDTKFPAIEFRNNFIEIEHTDNFEIIEIESNGTKIRFNLELSSEENNITVYRNLSQEYIIDVHINVENNPQRLKMLLNILNSMVSRSDLLSNSHITYRDLLI